VREKIARAKYIEEKQLDRITAIEKEASLAINKHFV